MVLLDTDIAVDLLRGWPSGVAWLATQSAEQIYLPGLVVMELIQGCANKRELTKVQDFVAPFPLLWAPPEVCDEALVVYASGKLTHNLGLLDAIIGQLAVSQDAVLYSFNQKHFAAIPGLKLVQPYAK